MLKQNFNEYNSNSKNKFFNFVANTKTVEYLEASKLLISIIPS